MQKALLIFLLLAGMFMTIGCTTDTEDQPVTGEDEGLIEDPAEEENYEGPVQDELINDTDSMEENETALSEEQTGEVIVVPMDA